MYSVNTVSKFRLNHIGFTCKGYKSFKIKEPKDKFFHVEYLEDTVYTVVFTGELIFFKGKDDEGYTGDFSAITKRGDYRINCGGEYSRHFCIDDGVYSNAVRSMLSFFTLQRCGSELGWAGKCHTDDGIIFETGEKVDLSGGYHQSCDLRKSPGGVSIGVLGMIKSYDFNNAEWGKTLYNDEIEWACDYYVKTVQADGCIYNTLNIPHGWGGRTFYKSPPPASASWNIIRILALGSKLISKKQSEYLSAAKRAWDFMASGSRPVGKYKHPEKTPLGMDADSFYETIYKDSTSDIAYKGAAAADFYRVTGDKKWLSVLEACANELLNRRYGGASVASAFLKTDKDGKSLTVSSGTYSWVLADVGCVCDAVELFSDSNYCGEWKKYLMTYLKNETSLVEDSFWKRPVSIYSEDNLNAQWGHVDINGNFFRVRDVIDTPLYSIDDKLSYTYSYFKTTTFLQRAVFAERIAKLLNIADCRFGQYIIDTLLGSNEMDMSHVEGVGFNQVLAIPYGQFFPSTPQLCGGINIGAANNIHGQSSSEYDMPAVGLAMLLLNTAANSH